MKNVAIVLSGGSGSRMGSDIPKQYLPLGGKPVLCYSLMTMEESPVIDEVVLVTRNEDLQYCRENIVERYGLHKVSRIVAGGAERYLSVYEGLKAVEQADYVYVHDGARPFMDGAMLERLQKDVLAYGSAVAAIPSKDTVKLTDADGYVTLTPERNTVWNIQTPQAFPYDKLKRAYGQMLATESRGQITDDAMVMEEFSEERVHLTMGSYDNLKLTTPEDLAVFEQILKRRKKTEF